MFFDEFCRSHSSYLLEISPSRRSLAISCIIEKFLNVGVRFLFQYCHDIVDTTFAEVFCECHSGVLLECISHIGAV